MAMPIRYGHVGLDRDCRMKRAAFIAITAFMMAAGLATFLVAYGVYTGLSEQELPRWTAVALATGSVLGVGAATISIVMGWWFNRQSLDANSLALRQERRLRTLEYVQAQLATPSIGTARIWMKEAKDRLHGGQEVDVAQELPPQVIDLCDLCNHVAAGLKTDALSASVVHAIMPFSDANSWFVNNWRLLEPYIEGLRDRLGESPFPHWEDLVNAAIEGRSFLADPE